MEHPLKGRIVCTDKSRKKLKYKNDAGEIVDDENGVALSKRFFTAIDKSNQTLITEVFGDITKKIEEFVKTEDNADEYTDILTIGVELMNQQVSCVDIMQGKDNALRDQFVKRLTRLIGK